MNVDDSWGGNNKDPLEINLKEVSNLVVKGAITLGLIGIVGSVFGGSE